MRSATVRPHGEISLTILSVFRLPFLLRVINLAPNSSV